MIKLLTDDVEVSGDLKSLNLEDSAGVSDFYLCNENSANK